MIGASTKLPTYNIRIKSCALIILIISVRYTFYASQVMWKDLLFIINIPPLNNEPNLDLQIHSARYSNPSTRLHNSAKCWWCLARIAQHSTNYLIEEYVHLEDIRCMLLLVGWTYPVLSREFASMCRTEIGSTSELQDRRCTCPCLCRSKIGVWI